MSLRTKAMLLLSVVAAALLVELLIKVAVAVIFITVILVMILITNLFLAIRRVRHERTFGKMEP